MKKASLLILLSAIYALCLAELIPIAPVKPDTLKHLGYELVDNWDWLKNRENPELAKHLKLEEKYTTQHLRESKKLSKQLFKEFTAWIPNLQSSPMREENGYVYYTRSYKNKPYPVHYRKKVAEGSREEILLDENKLAKGKDYFALGFIVVSPDARLLAYSTDFQGDEIYTLHIRNLTTGKTTVTGITGISDFVWQSDNQHAFITRQNERLQTDKCYRLDTFTNQQTVLYTEQNAAFDIGLYLSGDKSAVIMLSSSKSSTEAYYISRGAVSLGFTLIEPRRNGHQYFPDILNDKLYCQSNLWQQDYSISVCALANPQSANWKQLIAAQETMPIDGFQVFKDYLVLTRRKNGQKCIQVYGSSDALLHDEIIPNTLSDLGLWFNPDPGASSFTYYIENELSPYTIYNYSFSKRSSSPFYQSELGKPYHAEAYSSKLIFVPSHDGVQIPLSLVYRKGLDLSKPLVVWLSGYGAYGDPNDPWFSTSRLSLLDRDIIFATAHIRGGGEFGQQWYDAGRLQNKRNTFKDFESCVNYLLDNRMSTAKQLIIEGGSAGGLLMGAVTNLIPEKIGLVIADVPFVDMLSTMLDNELPLTQQEYEEWGNPNLPEDFAYMQSYSPYDNVKAAIYPKMLISAAWFDTRVGYWEGLKWAQKLRSNNLGTNPILFRLLSSEGHTGSTNIFVGLKSYAITYAYAITGIMN